MNWCEQLVGCFSPWLGIGGAFVLCIHIIIIIHLWLMAISRVVIWESWQRVTRTSPNSSHFLNTFPSAFLFRDCQHLLVSLFHKLPFPSSNMKFPTVSTQFDLRGTESCVFGAICRYFASLFLWNGLTSFFPHPLNFPFLFSFFPLGRGGGGSLFASRVLPFFPKLPSGIKYKVWSFRYKWISDV